MHNLAPTIISRGRAGRRTPPPPAQWRTEAADLGLVDSRFNLGRSSTRKASGRPRNAAEAYKWYQVAARSGDQESKTSAARVRGQLTPQALAIAERAAAAFRPSTPNAAPALAANAASVVTAQRALNQLGYYSGPTDGLSSSGLVAAIKSYQADQGMAATGVLDAATLSRLSVFTRAEREAAVARLLLLVVI